MPSEPCSMLWLDLETTGLDQHLDHILECAVFVTDPDGNNPRDHMEWVVFPNDEYWELRLNEQDGFVREMHTQSGLLEAIDENSLIETLFYDQLHMYCRAQLMKEETVGNKLTVAGSGVGPFDLPFLKNRYPVLDKYVNYWVMDVGVIGRYLRYCCKVDFPDRPNVAHRAMSDIMDHYDEFLMYRSTNGYSHGMH